MRDDFRRTTIGGVALAAVSGLLVLGAPALAQGVPGPTGPSSRSASLLPQPAVPVAVAPGTRSSVPLQPASPGAEHSSKTLVSLSADASDDAWVVGTEYFNGGATSSPYTLHWDGTTWTQVPSDPGGLNFPALLDVVAVSPDDVWAVGQEYTNGDNGTANLAMHWDGTSWSVVPTPDPAGQYLDLSRVSGVSPTQVYAAGTVCQSGEGPCASEVLRWNGHTWSVVAHPPAGNLFEISASSPSDALGVGASGDDAYSARWDGSRWKPARVPSTPYGERLFDVSDGGAGAGWAVGTELDNGGHQTAGYVLHWTGTKWQRVTAADQSVTSFTGVSADSASDAWMVGGADTERWDGTQWTAVKNPLQAKGTGDLLSVQALAPDDAWSLGQYEGPEAGVFALMHFDGTRWTITKRIGITSDSFTSGVSTVSTTDAWSVGGIQKTFDISRSVISRWNGADWQPVDHPNPGKLGTGLSGIDARTATDAWAVGYKSDAKYLYDSLIEHWDGSAWSVVASPNLPTDQNFLGSVSADSASDVWAVGQSETMFGGKQHGLAEHWDGSSWQLTHLPHGVWSLVGVDAVSPTDAWAVGFQKPSPHVYGTSVLHWDGTEWSVVQHRISTQDTSSAFNAVVASSSSDVWVLGSTSTYHHSGGKPEAPLALHWDGTSWTDVATPKRPFPESAFEGASTDGSGGVWAVGSEFDHIVDQGTPLIEHWDGTEWTVANMQPQQAGTALRAVSGGVPDAGWAVGVDNNRSLLMHWNGTIWRR